MLNPLVAWKVHVHGTGCFGNDLRLILDHVCLLFNRRRKYIGAMSRAWSLADNLTLSQIEAFHERIVP